MTEKNINQEFKLKNIDTTRNQLTTTQHPKEVPLWSYFCWDALEHYRTKIGRIRFLTYFGSANTEKFNEKPIYG